MCLRGPGVIALILVPTLSLSACGSGQGASTSRHLRPLSPAPLRRPRAVVPPIGTAQHVAANGTTLVVNVTSVIDPLRGSGAAVPSGMRAVGVLVAVRNTGPGTYDSSATGDFSLRTASGQASPVYVPQGRCQTPLQDFMNAMPAGGRRAGCVAFAIPAAQTAATVRFAPDGGAAGDRVSWTVQ